MKCYNTMSAQATETQWHYYSKSVCAHVPKEIALPRVSPSGEIGRAGSCRLCATVTLVAAPALFTHVSI